MKVILQILESALTIWFSIDAFCIMLTTNAIHLQVTFWQYKFIISAEFQENKNMHNVLEALNWK
jgi:hypothetical protein